MHAYLPARIEFMKNTLIQNYSIKEKFLFLKNFDIIDVGCGGGLMSEPMARLGGNVLGLDANKTSIEVATNHLKENSNNLSSRLTYQQSDIEKFS